MQTEQKPNNLNFDFDGKTVLVTGGGRGIGLQVSRQFLTAGANVIVWEYSAESIETAKLELAPFAHQLHFQQVDVSQYASVEKAAESLPRPIDILINNAGITRDKSFGKMTSEDFQAVIDTNLGGVFNCTKALLTKFADTPNKRIISISSVVALYGNFGQTNYVAAKAGVIGMTKTWARELSRKGFTANAVAPGFTLTPMVEAMPAQARKLIEDKIPAGRFGQPSDIANACMFLASAEAGYISGTVLSVDGALVI
ncbi:MAG: SDR family oxidoreductase [Bdellovibrionales bacterium]|jgi:3-oxoacyl-[acyl-carrier protein] reductase|nr:SDR family oxidoreductase [Bdellovibrionales bacterium]